jgi:glycosyltransferase involved in cell wall biosynthesis
VTVSAARYAFGETFYGAGAPDALGLGAASASLRAWGGALDGVRALTLAAARELSWCDALVSHFVLPCGAIAGALRAGRPHVCVVHGTDGWLLARLPRAAQRRVLAGASRVWYSHQALRDAVSHPAHVGSAVRPMGWEPRAASSHVARASALRVAMVSRLVPVKRVERAIDALALLRGRGLDAELTVAGDGPERARLEARARRVAPGAVTWLGAVDAPARDELLARANVFLHTAGAIAGGRTEGAPVALLEAMGAGLAVVACDAGGVRAMVGDGGVVLSGEARDHAMADALARFADPALRACLGDRARARVWPLRWEATAAWLEGLAGLET